MDEKIEEQEFVYNYNITGMITVKAMSKNDADNLFQTMEPGYVLEESLTSTLTGKCEEIFDKNGHLRKLENIPKEEAVFKPGKITYGKNTGKTYCGQYGCKHNYGMQRGVINDVDFPTGCCKLENPRIIVFDNKTWGCSDEQYGFGTQLQKPE